MDPREVLFVFSYQESIIKTWNGFSYDYKPPLYLTPGPGTIMYDGPLTNVNVQAYDITLDNQGYHQLKLNITPSTFRQELGHGMFNEWEPTENLVAIVNSYPTATIAKRAVYVDPRGHNFTTDTHAGDEQWFISKITYREKQHHSYYYIVYFGFKILMPTLQQVDPIHLSYEGTYRLTESGTIPATFTLTNPFNFSVFGKMDNDSNYTISTNLTIATAQYNFTGNDIGERTYTLKLSKSDTLPNDMILYYFYDDNGNIHSFCQAYQKCNYNAYPIYKQGPYVYITNDTIEYRVTVLDNTNILVFDNATIEAVRSSSQHPSVQYYLTDTGAIKLTYSFRYTAGANTYRLKLYDKSRSNGTVFIEKSFTSSASTISETLYSDALTKVETVDLRLEITDTYNRILTHDFGLITIRQYSRPKISYFDTYFSKADGSLDLQSTHISVLANFTYSPLDGTNLLQQEMRITGGGGSVIATIDPALVSETRKYFSNVTLPLGASYEVTFTITDTMGNSDSVTFPLNRTGNVLMDFNDTGFGMAIGKNSEENSLEINLPTIFYNDVEYINGTRQTADAASVLGCMDTYNVGVRTIQAALDYAIGRLI